jgi:hypothetical protein
MITRLRAGSVQTHEPFLWMKGDVYPFEKRQDDPSLCGKEPDLYRKGRGPRQILLAQARRGPGGGLSQNFLRQIVRTVELGN